jgi:porin
MRLARKRVVAIAGALLAPGAVAAQGEREEPNPTAGGAVDALAVYTGDLIRNTTGGLTVGSAYLNKLDLEIAVDGERAFGLPGLTLFVHGMHTNEALFSERYAGDVMVASNIDAPRATRLYEAWLDYAFAARAAASLRLGLYDLNTEFDAGDSRALFVNSSFGVGHELAQSGVSGPSIFPVTSLALRLALQPRKDWLFLAAALDAVPGDPDDPTATTIRLDPDEGALLVAEVQRTLFDRGSLRAGAWHYTKDGSRVDDAVSGVETPRLAGRQGIYGTADFAIWRRSEGSRQFMTAFARLGYASDSAHEYDMNAQAGFTWRQPWTDRDEELLGLAFSYARTGDTYRTARAALDAPVESGELAVELTYRRILTSWLMLQPTLQYIAHPSAERTLDDAFVVGIRFELAVSRAFF